MLVEQWISFDCVLQKSHAFEIPLVGHLKYSVGIIEGPVPE